MEYVLKNIWFFIPVAIFLVIDVVRIALGESVYATTVFQMVKSVLRFLVFYFRFYVFLVNRKFGVITDRDIYYKSGVEFYEDNPSFVPDSFDRTEEKLSEQFLMLPLEWIFKKYAVGKYNYPENVYWARSRRIKLGDYLSGNRDDSILKEYEIMFLSMLSVVCNVFKYVYGFFKMLSLGVYAVALWIVKVTMNFVRYIDEAIDRIDIWADEVLSTTTNDGRKRIGASKESGRRSDFDLLDAKLNKIEKKIQDINNKVDGSSSSSKIRWGVAQGVKIIFKIFGI